MKGKAPDRGAKARMALRRGQVLQLVLRGASSRSIAVALGVSRRTVRDDLAQVLADLAREQAAMAPRYRELELERLETITLRMSQLMSGLDTTRDGAPVAVLPMVQIAAAQTLVKVQERKARLLGLDVQPEVAPPQMPTGFTMTWNVPFDLFPPPGRPQLPAPAETNGTGDERAA